MMPPITMAIAIYVNDCNLVHSFIESNMVGAPIITPIKIEDMII